MNKYIIDLLSKDGSVTIPGFGCLTTSDDKLVFNEFVQFNDGKLINHIHEESGMGIQDIENHISKWYREILAEINIGNDFIIHGLGKFFKSNIDKIEFNAFNADISLDKNITAVDAVTIEEPVGEIIINQPAFEDKRDEIDIQAGENVKPILHEKNDSEDAPKNSLDVILDNSKYVSANTSYSADDKGREAKEEEIETDAAYANETIEDVPVKVEIEAAYQDEKLKKRGIFFYINLFILMLIFGAAVFAYFNYEEVSKLLGITKDNVIIEKQNEGVDATKEEASSELDSSENMEPLEQIDDNSSEPLPTIDAPAQEKIENIPAVISSGNFHIVVGTFSLKEYANRLVKKIQNAGFDGKIIKSSSSGHTVAFHSYKTREEANDQIEKAKEVTGTGAYILKE
jgi:nucleoid DNA-binding protein/cell division septation protein DedD